MAKKSSFGRVILFCTAACAAAAGLYFYLNQRDAALEDDFDDDFDDFDDASDAGEPAPKPGRKYVDLARSSADEKVEEDDFLDEDGKDTEEFFNDEEGDE